MKKITTKIKRLQKLGLISDEDSSLALKRIKEAEEKAKSTEDNLIQDLKEISKEDLLNLIS